MNEIAFQVRIVIADEGCVQRADALAIARRLQQVLHSYPEGYSTPIDLVRDRERVSSRAAGGRAAAARDGGLVLRIDLVGLPRAVWWRIEIPATRGGSFASREQLDDLGEDGEPSDTVTVGDLLAAPKGKLHWVYDFGDGWQHRITSEKTTPLADARIRCTAGRNAAPPEDCGGPPGYEELLVAIGDPSHPDHAELVEWLGAPFDPEEFDQAAINAELAGLRPGVQPRRR